MTTNDTDNSGHKGASRLIVLPFRKSLEIAVKSIRVRFFRSLITTISLILAVSFLSFTTVSTEMVNGLLSAGNPEWRQSLIRSGYDIRPEQVSVGSSPKQRWIIFLSLLACVVGIVNSQLMAVTERFREIGTMKCLGALDRFILRLFLLEAGIQGVIGAGAGAMIGAVAAVVNGFLRYGTVAVTHISWIGAGESVAAATLVGFLLSLAGVMYPAWVAARMQPVEAMRVEH
jgi:predicted lysophospholipase L1 biosynthesis ABC-type transport system permease subunit